MARESLSELMTVAARELSHQSSAQTTMQVAVDVSVRDIDGAEAAALSIAQRRSRVDTLAATSNEARLADELQYELGEGPCLHAVWEELLQHRRQRGGDGVEAFLHHALPLPPLERDMLAHAVNELIGHRPVIYAPYSADLTGAHGAEHEEKKSFAQDDDADDG